MSIALSPTLVKKCDGTSLGPDDTPIKSEGCKDQKVSEKCSESHDEASKNGSKDMNTESDDKKLEGIVSSKFYRLMKGLLIFYTCKEAAKQRKLEHKLCLNQPVVEGKRKIKPVIQVEEKVIPTIGGAMEAYSRAIAIQAASVFYGVPISKGELLEKQALKAVLFKKTAASSNSDPFPLSPQEELIELFKHGVSRCMLHRYIKFSGATDSSFLPGDFPNNLPTQRVWDDYVLWDAFDSEKVEAHMRTIAKTRNLDLNLAFMDSRNTGCNEAFHGLSNLQQLQAYEYNLRQQTEKQDEEKEEEGDRETGD
eukprot:Platyproteum_vivax@DN3033_c0_g1_i1.p1